ncbi:hypothetical protein NIES4074_47490 [Cylindrospermum sp. NIES-4074]|nr:hypothetical protein NIES4074_47490 [Cylindrospermum sp. NIES-4074]
MSKLWVGVKGLGIVITGAIAFSGNSAIANMTQDTNLSKNLDISTQKNTRIVESGNQSGSNQSRSCKQRSVSTLGIANFQNTANFHYKNSGATNRIYSRLGNDTLKLQYSLDPTYYQVNTAVKKQEAINLTGRSANINTINERCLVCGFNDYGAYVCIYYDC